MPIPPNDAELNLIIIKGLAGNRWSASDGGPLIRIARSAGIEVPFYVERATMVDNSRATSILVREQLRVFARQILKTPLQS